MPTQPRDEAQPKAAPEAAQKPEIIRKEQAPAEFSWWSQLPGREQFNKWLGEFFLGPEPEIFKELAEADEDLEKLRPSKLRRFSRSKGAQSLSVLAATFGIGLAAEAGSRLKETMDSREAAAEALAEQLDNIDYTPLTGRPSDTEEYRFAAEDGSERSTSIGYLRDTANQALTKIFLEKRNITGKPAGFINNLTEIAPAILPDGSTGADMEKTILLFRPDIVADAAQSPTPEETKRLTDELQFQTYLTTITSGLEAGQLRLQSEMISHPLVEWRRFAPETPPSLAFRAPLQSYETDMSGIATPEELRQRAVEFSMELSRDVIVTLNLDELDESVQKRVRNSVRSIIASEVDLQRAGIDAATSIGSDAEMAERYAAAADRVENAWKTFELIVDNEKLDELAGKMIEQRGEEEMNFYTNMANLERTGSEVWTSMAGQGEQASDQS